MWSLEAWKLEESDHGPRRWTVVPNGHRQSFHPNCSSVRRDDLTISEDVVSLEQCNRLLAAGYHCRHPARCPRLLVDQRRCHHMWAPTHRMWDLRHWRHRVFSDASHSMQFHSDGRARVHSRQGQRPMDACIQPLDGNHGPLVKVLDNRFNPAARLCIDMMCRFLRRLSVWSIVNRLLTAGYQSRHPARCPSLTLDQRRCHHVWGPTHRRWNLRHWRHYVSSDESRFT